MTTVTPKCPNCGASVGIDMQECPYCGASVIVSAQLQAISSAIKCPKCSRPNKEGSAFCEFCGAKLLLNCPSCRNPVKVGKAVCRHCGVNILEHLQERIMGHEQGGGYSLALAYGRLLEQFDTAGTYTRRIASTTAHCRAKLIAMYEDVVWETARRQTRASLASLKKPLLFVQTLAYASPGVFKKQKKGFLGPTMLPPARGLLLLHTFADSVRIGFQTFDEHPRGWAGHSLGGNMPIITSTEVEYLSLTTWPIEVFEDKLVVDHARQGYQDVIFKMPKGSPRFVQELVPRVCNQAQLGNLEALVSATHPSEQ